MTSKMAAATEKAEQRENEFFAWTKKLAYDEEKVRREGEKWNREEQDARQRWRDDVLKIMAHMSDPKGGVSTTSDGVKCDAATLLYYLTAWKISGTYFRVVQNRDECNKLLTIAEVFLREHLVLHGSDILRR